jgi:hypothetical protein
MRKTLLLRIIEKVIVYTNIRLTNPRGKLRQVIDCTDQVDKTVVFDWSLKKI